MATESASRGDTEPPAVEGSDAPAAPRRGLFRNALAWFVAAEVIAFPLLLVWGRHGWFTQDDWDFLSARTAGNAGDLFRAHFQHWTTLPILVYRLMWVLVGLHSYTPYQVLIVTAHLVAAALILVVMRRAGVRPWLATVVAVTFIFFGAGAENILVAFQITFVGAFVFGLTQLLLSDHDGPIDRRDWLGLLAGFAGLTCSGVAVTMTVVVGLAVLLRRGPRGWRVALFHTAPLALAYIMWSKLSPKGQVLPSYRSHSPTQIAKFLLIGVEAAFARLGHVPGIGIALGFVLVAGLVLVFRGHRGAPLGRLAAPIALLAGGALFLVVTGVARAGTGTERARDSRYVYLVAAMAMPALALGADALMRRWRYLAVPLVALLVVGLPGNIHRLANPESLPPFANAAQTRAEILVLPRLPLAQQLRHSRRPVPIQYPRFALEGLTFGWLVDAAASGRIPDPGPLNPVLVSTRELQLFLVPGQATSAVHCQPAPKLSIHELAAGQTITFERGRVFVTYVRVGGPPSLRLPFKPTTLVALAGPMRLRVVPANKGVLICN